jgi:fructan beta-fructosidase
MRLEDYRRSPDYYREEHRPAYHFSPEIHWMNDPNGLVFQEGEFHLFYQHNPFGDSWGHMSWGHAVSRDLVHWRHLPVALREEAGVMIFSGCAVVDEKNSSGFGGAGEPPLVAVYTGHSSAGQAQCLAWSTDRGRSWTKYEGNPVIDIGERDFRDPKVCWHEATRRWIMVVALAAARKVRFYASRDLKRWTQLSDFGPAGAAQKRNWECPDLFALPIEGSAGERRWVLQVSMGTGSVAGGSGAEYFVGSFDGESFSCDDPPEQVLWVDHGRDFYAAVSWSGIPPSDGRCIWIGWMNNWETALLPTAPWRGALSIPRVLALRSCPEGLRMVQTPVEELQQLRRNRCRLESRELAPGLLPLSDCGISGEQLELRAVFELSTADGFGLEVRKQGDEKTVVGYDTRRREVFVDRGNSGQWELPEGVSERHSAPLAPEDGLIDLHVFVDRSSVEVFANRGRVVITDRIFPRPGSRGVDLYSSGAGTRLASLDAWELRSVWS